MATMQFSSNQFRQRGVMVIFLLQHLMTVCLSQEAMVTTTMLGFAEFVTTRDNTVIHFKPNPTLSQGTSSVSIDMSSVNSMTAKEALEPTSSFIQPESMMSASMSTEEKIIPSSITATAVRATNEVSMMSVVTPSLDNNIHVTSSIRPPRKVEGGPGPGYVDAESLVGHSQVMVMSSMVIDPSPVQDFYPTSDLDNSEVNVHIEVHDGDDDGIVGGGEKSYSDHQHVIARAAIPEADEAIAVAVSAAAPPQMQKATESLPTGLVTVLGGTVVQNGITTIHETRVIGTYINGKYAQILQSTSKIFDDKNPKQAEIKPSPAAVLTPPSSEAVPSMNSQILSSLEGAESSDVTTSQAVVTPSMESIKSSHNRLLPKSRPAYSGINRNKNTHSSSSEVQSSPVEPENASKTRFSRELSVTASGKSVKPTPIIRMGAPTKGLPRALASQRSRFQNRNNKRTSSEIQVRTITPQVGMASSQLVNLDMQSSSIQPTATKTSATHDEKTETEENSKPTRSRKLITVTRSAVRAKSRGSDRNAIKPTGSSSYSRFTYTRNPSKYYPRRRPRPTISSSETTTEDSNAITPTEEPLEARALEVTSPIGELSTIISTFTTEFTQYYGPRSSMKSLVFTTTFEQPVVVTVGDLNNETISPSEPLQIIGISTSVKTQVSSGDEEEIEGREELDSSLIESSEGKDKSEAGYATSTPPLALAVDGSTGEPQLDMSTVTEEFTTTETVMQTSLLPIFNGESTSFYTMTNSYYVTKIVTALKTVPPKDLLPFIVVPKKRVKGGPLPHVDLNAAESEQREDSIFPDNSQSDESFDPIFNKSDILSLLNITNGRPSLNELDKKEDRVTETPLTTDTTPPQNKPPVPNVPGYGGLPFFNPFLNPLAYFGLGLPMPNQEQVITTSKPIYSTETIYGTKVLPIWDGIRTSFHTTKAPSTTIVHTSYETYTTQMVPNANPFANNFAPMQTITSSTTIVTTETLTSTQVLKLMYDGYKTSYRTRFSTMETVKTITTETTTTVPYATQMPTYFG